MLGELSSEELCNVKELISSLDYINISLAYEILLGILKSQDKAIDFILEILGGFIIPSEIQEKSKDLSELSKDVNKHLLNLREHMIDEIYAPCIEGFIKGIQTKLSIEDEINYTIDIHPNNNKKSNNLYYVNLKLFFGIHALVQIGAYPDNILNRLYSLGQINIDLDTFNPNEKELFNRFKLYEFLIKERSSDSEISINFDKMLKSGDKYYKTHGILLNFLYNFFKKHKSKLKEAVQQYHVRDWKIRFENMLKCDTNIFKVSPFNLYQYKVIRYEPKRKTLDVIKLHYDQNTKDFTIHDYSRVPVLKFLLETKDYN